MIIRNTRFVTLRELYKRFDIDDVLFDDYLSQQIIRQPEKRMMIHVLDVHLILKELDEPVPNIYGVLGDCWVEV